MSRGGQILSEKEEGEKNEMDRLSIRFLRLSPKRERGQVYISGREEKTKECGLLSGPLSADSPFGRLRHQTTIGRQGGGVGVTLFW